MKRKKWLSVLGALFCCCCLLGVSACNDDKKGVDLTSFELTTVKPSTEEETMFVANPKASVLVGSCIDVEDYIIKHKDGLNRAVQFQFTDKAGVTQTVATKGVTYYPTVSGKYTMIYTEQFADKILRDSMEITVYSPQPEVEVSPIPLYYSKGSSVKFRLLLNNANPYCETSSDFTIESVTYRQYEVDLEETVKEGTEQTTDLIGQTQYTFEEYGTYLFSFFTEVDGLKGYGNIRVEVLEENVGNEDTLVKEDGSYASSNVQTDGNTVRLIQAEYAAASYLVLEEDYYDQDVLRVEFKGKNVPNIGLLTVANEEANNPYNLVSGEGYTLSFENTYVDKFSIWGYGGNFGKGEGRFGGMNLHNGNSITGYWGRNDFENDKYYLIEMRLDTASVDELLSVFYLNVYEIENYGTAEQSYKNVYDAKVPAGQTEYGKIEKGKIVFYSSAKEDVTFKYYKPVGRVKNFAVNGTTVSWAAMDGAVGYMVSPNGVNYTFQTETSFTLNNYIKDLTPLYVKPVVDNGFMKLEDGSAKLEWTELNSAGVPEVKRNLTDGPAVFNKYVPKPTEAYEGDDFEVSAGGALAQEVGLDQTHASVTLPFISAAQQNYVITKDTYGAGTYVAMEFIGSKHPSFVLFGVTENSQDAHGAVGVGIDLDKNTFGAVGYYKASADAARTDTAIKPMRLTRGYFKSTQTGGIFAREADFPFAAVTKYLLVIGAAQEGANVNINYYLYAQTGATEWSLYEVNALEVPNATLNEGKISVRSSAVVAGQVSEFKMYKPNTLNNLNATLQEVYGVQCFDSTAVFHSSGAANVDLNTDGTYQLSLPMVAGNDKAYNYLATKAQYGSGTYLMTEFSKETQNNVPSMILFGVDNVTDTLTFDTTGLGYNKQQTTWNGVGVCTDHWNNTVAFYQKAASGTATYKTQGNAKFCRNTDTGDYVLLIGAENAAAGVTVSYTLYKKEGTALTKVETYSYTFAGASMSSGSILFASPHLGAGSVADLKLWTIDTKANVEAKLTSTYTVNA